MAQVEIWHNPRCSKSRQTLELLTKKGVDIKITEYLNEQLTANEINTIASKLGLKPSQFLRKGEFTKLGIIAGETESEIIKQMEQYPILIERPIVINGSQARIGRPPESVLDIV